MRNLVYLYEPFVCLLSFCLSVVFFPVLWAVLRESRKMAHKNDRKPERQKTDKWYTTVLPAF